jgi:nicotinamide riboside kinase
MASMPGAQLGIPTRLRSIYVVGAPCSGKTTLITALKSHRQLQGARFITEVARTVLHDQQFQTSDIRALPAASLELQRAILEAQLQAEMSSSGQSESGSLNAPQVALNPRAESTTIVSDRSGIDPIVFAAMYGPPGGVRSLLESGSWHYLRSQLQTSLVVLCEPVEEWLRGDGVRLMPEGKDEKGWSQLHMLFCEMLEREKVKYTILPEHIRSTSDRVDFVLRAWTDQV